MGSNGKAHYFYIGKLECFRNPNGRGLVSVPMGNSGEYKRGTCKRLSSFSPDEYDCFVKELADLNSATIEDSERNRKKSKVVKRYFDERQPYYNAGGIIVLLNKKGEIVRLRGVVDRVTNLEDSVADLVTLKDDEKEAD